MDWIGLCEMRGGSGSGHMVVGAIEGNECEERAWAGRRGEVDVRKKCDGVGTAEVLC